jgi:hypothetical protein
VTIPEPLAPPEPPPPSDPGVVGVAGVMVLAPAAQGGELYYSAARIFMFKRKERSEGGQGGQGEDGGNFLFLTQPHAHTHGLHMHMAYQLLPP